MFKPKLTAAFIHLGVSAFVVASFLTFALLVWYPAPFFGISGLATILLLLVAIDLILGPLLTFIVFKPQKRTLKFDLGVIAAVQIAALVYGMHTIYQAHPLYVAYAIDRFTPINANEVSPEAAQYDELKKSKLSGPTLVYVEKPSDPAEMSRVTMEVFSGKPDLDARPEYYKPFASHRDAVLAQGLDVSPWLAKPEHKTKLDNFLKKHGDTHGNNLKDYAFLPLVGKEQDVLWAFSRTTGEPVGIVEISPWNG